MKYTNLFFGICFSLNLSLITGISFSKQVNAQTNQSDMPKPQTGFIKPNVVRVIPIFGGGSQGSEQVSSKISSQGSQGSSVSETSGNGNVIQSFERGAINLTSTFGENITLKGSQLFSSLNNLHNSHIRSQDLSIPNADSSMNLPSNFSQTEVSINSAKFKAHIDIVNKNSQQLKANIDSLFTEDDLNINALNPTRNTIISLLNNLPLLLEDLNGIPDDNLPEVIVAKTEMLESIDEMVTFLEVLNDVINQYNEAINVAR